MSFRCASCGQDAEVGTHSALGSGYDCLPCSMMHGQARAVRDIATAANAQAAERPLRHDVREWLATYRAALTGLLSTHPHVDDDAIHKRASWFANQLHGECP